MTYKASLGISSIVITAIVSLLLAGLNIFLIYRAVDSPEILESIVSIAVVVLMIGLYTLAYLYRTLGYSVGNEVVTIKRPVKDVSISIKDIKDAFLIRRESMQWTERVGGNGGLFGFYGEFKNGFGYMTWYATKSKNYLMIETIQNEKIVLTPNDTSMVKEIRRLIGK